MKMSLCLPIFEATLLKDQDKIDEMQKLVDKAIEKKTHQQ